VQKSATEVVVVAVAAQQSLVTEAVAVTRSTQANISAATAVAVGLVAAPPILEAPTLEDLKPQEIKDTGGVLNGGQQMYGLASAPQVVAEDGTLTPAAPLPGTGFEIPPEAITTEATFVGQPGGTTFNSPDIAVPIVETPVELPAAVAAVPGVQAAATFMNQAYIFSANIGNDLSPSTRKKAKKIIIATVIVGQITNIRVRSS